MEVCRLCLDLATESDVKKLEGTYKDATQIVVPEVNTDISSSPVICQQCTSSLDELYTFKASVVEAENQIKEKVGEDKCQLRLKEVMTGVKIEEKDADLGKSKDRMCRTCLCAIEGKTFTLLKPTQSDAYLNSMLLMCLPEMDLDLTLDPVMCEQCLCNLQKLYHFKSSCLDVEERLNSYCEQHGSSSSSQINLHSVLEEDAAKPKDSTFDAVKSESVDSSVGDYKSEEGDDDVSMSDNSKDLGYTVVNVKKEERDMLKEEDDSEDGDESMGDDAENFTDEEIGELKQEELKIEDDDGDEAKKQENAAEGTHSNSSIRQVSDKNKSMPLLKCAHCKYSSTNKRWLQKHIRRRHNQEGLPLLKCDLCDYTTRVRENLGKHINNNHTRTPIVKCELCDYTSKSMHNFKRHFKARHIPRPLWRCDLCDFASRFKENINKHVRNIHGPIIKCEYCKYTSKNKYNVQKHYKTWHTPLGHPECKCTQNDELCECTRKFKNRHNDELDSEGKFPLMKCQLCDYLTKKESHLKKHVKSVHNGQIMNCDHCEYTTRILGSLKKHMTRRHPQILLKCDLCTYSSTIQQQLHKHVSSVHSVKSPVLKCKQCEYTTAKKNSLKSHIFRRHTQELPWLKCVSCDYKSRVKRNLHNHIHFMHMMKCEHCEYRTQFENELERHMDTCHK